MLHGSKTAFSVGIERGRYCRIPIGIYGSYEVVMFTKILLGQNTIIMLQGCVCTTKTATLHNRSHEQGRVSGVTKHP